MEIKRIQKERRNGWAMEGGIAECYHAVNEKYKSENDGQQINVTCVYRCPVHNTAIGSKSIDSKHLIGKAMDIDMGANNWDGYRLNWKAGRAAFEVGNCVVKIHIGNGDYELFTADMSKSEKNSEGKYWWEIFPFLHIHVEVD